MNLIDFFDGGALQNGNSPCFVAEDGATLTYAQVQAQTLRIARALQRLGLEPGFHGAVMSANDPLAFVAVLGIVRAEGAWLPVNVRNAVAANVEFLDDMDCDVLFYQSRWSEQLPQIRSRCPRIRHFICLDDGAQGGDLSLADWSRGESDEFFWSACDPEATAVILATGGTTGRSKGVMLSHRNVAAMCASQMSAARITHRMVYLAAAPITHTAGLLALPFIARGARVILHDGVDPQRLLRAIERDRVEALFLPPTAIYALLTQPNVREFDLSSLRYLLYGAAPMSPDKLAEAIEVFGPVLYQGYGQSEVPGSISVLLPEEHFVDGQIAPRERLSSAGRPYPFTRVAIAADDGTVHRRPGERGEIVAQGDIVMKGYYKNPQASAEASAGGWHRTGDIGYFDADGFLYLVDRKKDMIITGGFNVYPAEVEAVLMAHPAVNECAVVGVPDDKWGEAVKAVVELRPNATVTESALIELVKKELGSVKAPKSVEFADQLPRSTVGKVLKRELRARYWANSGRVI
ncbi:AMP-binding protein [Cupriavidus sp. NPDC089707]|uniref:AMP-binding protein n=1 Tax=Cupriavidus sp. NPDC089707 TaxID=3363963 RepID=UPI00381CA6E2